MSDAQVDIELQKRDCRFRTFGQVGRDCHAPTTLIIIMNDMLIPAYDKLNPEKDQRVYIVEITIREDS